MSDETNRSSGSTRSSVVSILQPPHSSPAAGGNIKHSSDCDDATTIGSFGEEEEPEKDCRPFLSQRMVDRVRRFILRLAARTQDLKKIRPDSPSSLDSYVSKSATSNAAQETENDDKKGEHVERSDEEIPDSNPFRIFKSQMSSRLSKFTASVNVLKKGLQAIDPNSKAYLVWLFLVSMAFLYNCMATVLRGTFTACPIYSCSVNSNVVPFCPSDPVPWLPSTPDPSDPLRVNATFRQPPENSSTPLPILKSSSSSVPLGGGPALPTSTPRSRDLSPVDRPAFTIYSASHLSDYSLRFCRAMFCKSADGSGDVPTNNSTGNDSRLDYFITPRLGSASTPAEAGVTIVPSTTNIFTITGNWSAAESSRSVLYNTTSDSTSFNSSESSFTDLWKTTTPNLTTGVVDSDQKPDFTAVGTQGKKCVVIGCFPGYETERNRHLWWTIDYLCDFVYALDVLLVKTRVVFLKNGLTEVNIRETAKHYVYGSTFKLDVISILPTDLFYLIPALNFNSLVRLNRLLKIRTFWEFYERLDQTVSSGYIVRVAKTMTYMLYLIHVEACVYFEVCKYIGVGTDGWVWGGKTLPYIHCMYLSTKTAASIGNNWSPTIQEEYLFMTVYWLIGLFIFAILIGQIRDIFRSSSVNREKYRMAIDQTMFYLKSLGVSPELQGRVLMWFNFNWLNSKTLDENALLDPLPRKMRTDLAIHVHLSTLSKVKLFQDCEKSLLYDLVLKLKPVLFLPGDYICKKGEVGTEMYIVKMGIIEVVGGPNNSIVFATLREGSVFGEISLMALSGGNRRTADVRSKGYSQLFLLSKADFEEAMSDYPEAYKMLKRKSKKLLSQNKKTDDKPKEEPQEPPPEDNGPKLYQTVLKVVETNQDHQNKWPVLSFQAWTSNSNQSYVRRSFQDFIPTAMEKNRDRQKKSNSKKKQNIKMKRDESHSSPTAFNDRREEIEITQLDSSATGSVYSINESSVDASGEAVHQSRRNYRKKKRNSPQNDVVDRISLGESDPAVKFDSKTVIPGQTSQDGEIVFLNHVDIAKTVPKTILKRGKSSIGIMTTNHSREQILGCVEESRPASDSKPTSIGSTSYLAYLYSKIHLRNKPKQPDLNERV